MQTLPNRATDAGPENVQEPAPDWVDYLYFAADEITDCRRLNHDNLQQELTLRQEAIGRAIEHLQAARAALPRQRTVSDLGVS
jgi:hypothetical protein